MKSQFVLVGAAFAAVTVAGWASGAQAVSFVNGGFEAGVSTGWDLMTPANTPGWVAIYGSPASFPRLNLNQANGGPYGNNNEGKQFATIGGTEDGGTSVLEQTVAGFTPGKTYKLSWLQSSEFSFTDDLLVSFASGSSTSSQVFSSVPYPGGSQFWYTWQSFSKTFVADAASVTFDFSSFATNTLGQTNYEVGVDNFQLSSAVPELSTWGMMLLGFVGLGLMYGRTSRKIAIA
jgi:hypothetical protein